MTNAACRTERALLPGAAWPPSILSCVFYCLNASRTRDFAGFVAGPAYSLSKVYGAPLAATDFEAKIKRAFSFPCLACPPLSPSFSSLHTVLCTFHKLVVNILCTLAYLPAMPLDHVGYYVPSALLEQEVSFLLAAFKHMNFSEFGRPIPSVVGLGTPHDPFLWVASISGESTGKSEAVHVAVKADSECVFWTNLQREALDPG